jgi:hypothetical protein
MSNNEQPYDPYIPQGGAQNNAAGGNGRTAALQAVGQPDTSSVVIRRQKTTHPRSDSERLHASDWCANELNKVRKCPESLAHLDDCQ